jgi:small-conductance mechanosensitive channel
MEDILQNELAVKALATLTVLLVIAFVVHLVKRFAKRYFHDPERIYRAGRSTRRFGLFLGFLGIVIIWSPGFGDLWTLLTVIGAGMMIAMREVLLAVAGWLRITLLNTYKDGDRIEVNGVQGDVIDVRVLRTTLMEIGGWADGDQSTGRIVHFPNGWIYEHAVYNYTRSFRFIWNELSLTVTFRSDWRAAREIILRHAEESAAIVEQQARQEIHEMSREFLIHYSILTPFVYVKITENGVKLTLRYLCEARKRRGSEHALTVVILDDFKDHGGIELAHNMLGMVPPDAIQFGKVPPQRPPENR